MYTVDRPIDVEAGPRGINARRGWRGVGPTVWFLGLTSLLTDVSSEMISSVVPLYRLVHLGISPVGFGVVDGLQHGVSALMRLASGTLADRFHRYKEVAAAGYALSVDCRLALLPAGSSLPALEAAVATDLASKGIRSSPRDAMISLEGGIRARQLRVVREGVECPSLSPDGRRLVVKSRRVENGRQRWGMRVLVLATGEEKALDGEVRSVDDQAVWLDDRHVLYSAAGGPDPCHRRQ